MASINTSTASSALLSRGLTHLTRSQVAVRWARGALASLASYLLPPSLTSLLVPIAFLGKGCSLPLTTSPSSNK